MPLVNPCTWSIYALGQSMPLVNLSLWPIYTFDQSMQWVNPRLWSMSMTRASQEQKIWEVLEGYEKEHMRHRARDDDDADVPFPPGPAIIWQLANEL